MALEKVDYKDGETVISAKNLNAIQDEIIANTQEVEALKSQVSALAEATVE